MLRLSKLTDYAIVILSFIAKDDSRVFSAVEIATSTGIATPTVSKLLKLLVNAKVLTSTRGSKGGYALAAQARDITLVTVINAVEGAIALTECSVSEKNCTQASGCHIYGNWQRINQTIHNALAAVSLADMIKPIMPKEIHIPIANITKSN